MLLGMKKALVVRSTVGDLSLDEIVVATNVMDATPGLDGRTPSTPRTCPCSACELSDLRLGDAPGSTRECSRTRWADEKGPVADCLMLNAGVAMAAAAQAESVAEGVAMCKEAHAIRRRTKSSSRSGSSSRCLKRSGVKEAVPGARNALE